MIRALLLLLLFAAPACADPVRTAQAFLDDLSADQRSKAWFRFDTPDRYDWHWVPRDRNGISLKEMRPAQRELGFAMAGAVLSEGGLAKTRAIIARESVLARTEGASFRDPERYWFAVFGVPGDAAGWGWRLEGHHLSLNVTLKGSEVTSTTPSFTGANPSVMPDNTLMGPEQALARDLLASLDDAQRERAVVRTRPPGGFMVGRRDIDWPIGLPAAAMNAAQRTLLRRLIGAYVENWRADIATRELNALDVADLNDLHFAWAGGAAPGQDYYYRIQAPTLLIEHDNTQNRANHIHAFWRSPRDFGG
jgi:hypothetical protein